MASIVRVKRSIHEEPLGALVLSARKRRRIDADGDAAAEGNGNALATDSTATKDDITAVLKFAGTVATHDIKAAANLARTNKEIATQLVAQMAARQPVNVVERGRQEQHKNSAENRFRVVNRLRAIVNDEDEDNGEDAIVGGATKELTILDIEKEVYKLQAEVTTEAVKEKQFVYDIYMHDVNNAQNVKMLPAGAEFDDDHEISVNSYEIFSFEDPYNDDQQSNDSEDSNCENYYTNDYPDEDDGDDEDDYIHENRGDESHRDDLGYKLNRMKLQEDSDDSDDYHDGDDDEDNSSGDDDVLHDAVDPYIVTEEPLNFVEDVDVLVKDSPEGSSQQKRIIKRIKYANKEADNDDDEDDDEEFQSANED